MPPKTKIHKELIVSTAYEMTKMNGIDSVTAKAIAKQLNCSIQPVAQSDYARSNKGIRQLFIC